MNENHDRLDKILPAIAYTAPECGAINLKTGKPHYCDFECPTLHGAQPHPEPHWITDPAKVADRMAELKKANYQAIDQAEPLVTNLPADMAAKLPEELQQP